MADPQIRAACRRVPTGWDCHVNIRDESGPAGASDYDVTISDEELTRYGSEASPERLVTASFQFLLERERPDQILRRFRLSQIEDYFPEFPAEIGRLLD
jgi:hypothetical protein